MVKEKDWYIQMLQDVALTLKDLGIKEVDGLDKKLADVPPERYNEEIGKLLQNVPIERKEFTQRFLENRRQIGLMKKQ
jgi:hypothetical protein